MDLQVPQIESRTDNLVKYAAVYAEMGFIPIPVQATGKIPSISAWQKQKPGVQAAKDRLSDHQRNARRAIPHVAKLKTVQTIRVRSKNSETSNEHGNPVIPTHDLRPSVVLDLV